MKIIALIPARYKSTRLPSKPLFMFGDLNMIQRVYLQTIKSKYITKSYVVTDHESIEKSINDISGNVIMVKDKCLNGTERICLALKKLDTKPQLIVNVQGDEPFIDPKHIDIAIEKMINNKNDNCVCSTLHYHITNQFEINNKNVGKLVLDKKNYILYCSRTCIPANKKRKINGDHKYYGHIGVFVFKSEYLNEFYESLNTPLQLEEDIEWLKILENGYKIISSLVSNSEIGVNTIDDYNYLLKKYNL